MSSKHIFIFYIQELKEYTVSTVKKVLSLSFLSCNHWLPLVYKALSEVLNKQNAKRKSEFQVLFQADFIF